MRSNGSHTTKEACQVVAMQAAYAHERTAQCLGVHTVGDVMLRNLSTNRLSRHCGGQQRRSGADLLAQQRRRRAAEHRGRWDSPGWQALRQRAVHQSDSMGHGSNGNHGSIWRGGQRIWGRFPVARHAERGGRPTIGPQWCMGPHGSGAERGTRAGRFADRAELLADRAHEGIDYSFSRKHFSFNTKIKIIMRKILRGLRKLLEFSWR
jgi:hypothetical protein